MEAVDGRGGVHRSGGARARWPHDRDDLRWGQRSPLLGTGIALILLSVASFGLALFLANMHGRPTAADFGLRRPPLARSIGLLLAVWVGLTVATVLWGAAVKLDDEEGQALTDRLGTEGTLAVLILFVVVTVVAPVEEEFLYRGYILRALRNWRACGRRLSRRASSSPLRISDGYRSRS
ncbi:hypothetical protein BH20ACT14_BH20ACT14_12060 [soil metagenome]